MVPGRITFEVMLASLFSSATQADFHAPGGVSPLDTAADERILVAIRERQEISSPITLVLNWDQEMKR